MAGPLYLDGRSEPDAVAERPTRHMRGDMPGAGMPVPTTRGLLAAMEPGKLVGVVAGLQRFSFISAIGQTRRRD
jgi:hypothetical protein